MSMGAARSRLAMQFLSGKFFRSLVARVKAWKTARGGSSPIVAASLIKFATFTPAIHRDVSPNGVRVYSLCGCCGARMNASATLCEECAQKKRPARPL
jgi:hypothetical protein